MAITTSNPIAIVHPEIPFDKVAVGLIIQPIFRPQEVSASVMLTLRHYRQLPDGSIEQMPSIQGSEPMTQAIGDVFQAASADPVLAQALGTIYSAIQAYLAGKGL